MTLHYETYFFLNALLTLIEPTLKIYKSLRHFLRKYYNEYHLKQAQYYAPTKYMEVIILCKTLNCARIMIVHVSLNLCFSL